MNFIKSIKTFSTLIILMLGTQTLAAQDMLARQAPVDRKMRAVDTLALRNIIEREQANNPGMDLYEDWNNQYAHRATQLPDSFRINLRHFCMPTPSRVVTSNFGARWGRQHKGLDIKVYTGDTIRAAFSGKVRITNYEAAGYGYYVVIRHGNGLETIYAHLSKQLVKENENVRAGDPIGLGGSTGRSTGSHLHFETRLCGVALNPALLFDFRNQDVTGDYYDFRARNYERESRQATADRGVVGNGGYTREMVTGEKEVPAPQQDRRQQAVQTEEVRYHKVNKGETLYSIAQKHGMSVDELCRINKLKKNRTLRSGQIIRLS